MTALSSVTSTVTSAAPVRDRSRTATITGWTLTGLLAAFLLFDGVSHVANLQVVKDAMATLGYPRDVAPAIGVVELICLALFLLPRTAPLGAVLLTGYLGGAVATQLRVEAPLFGTVLFPVYLGVVLWAGLWLRDRRVRALLAR